jgi:hypothetical protein
VTTPAYIADTLLSPSPPSPPPESTFPSSQPQEEVISNSLLKLRRILRKVYYPPIVGVWTAYPDNAFKVKSNDIIVALS